ncbi:MAG: hypothetical protein WCE62_22050 [Polyangiales bacterium]
MAVNTSEDFVNTSGNLEVVDIASQTLVRIPRAGSKPATWRTG